MGLVGLTLEGEGGEERIILVVSESAILWENEWDIIGDADGNS